MKNSKLETGNTQPYADKIDRKRAKTELYAVASTLVQAEYLTDLILELEQGHEPDFALHETAKIALATKKQLNELRKKLEKRIQESEKSEQSAI